MVLRQGVDEMSPFKSSTGLPENLAATLCYLFPMVGGIPNVCIRFVSNQCHVVDATFCVCIHLASERWYPERVKHIIRFQLERNFLTYGSI